MGNPEMPIRELDSDAASGRPNLRIVTVDDPNPQERDDGYSVVLPFRTRPDLFRVSVCIADPSSAYYRDDVHRQALEKTTAKYWVNPDGSRGYEPMINPKVIKKHEFTKGKKVSALVLAFTVGPEKPPSETEIYFDEVDVVSNMDFHAFARKCRIAKGMRQYGEASELLRRHLGYTTDLESHRNRSMAVNVERGSQISAHGGKEVVRMHGSRANADFMITANHLIPTEMARLGHPFIYRVCNPADGRFRDIVPDGRALYSMTPGQHDMLGLNLYSHVTSPLRRGVDLVLGHVLKKFTEGHSMTARDMRDMEFMTRQSNDLILAEAREGKGGFRLPKPVYAKAAVANTVEVA